MAILPEHGTERQHQRGQGQAVGRHRPGPARDGLDDQEDADAKHQQDFRRQCCQIEIMQGQ